MERVALFPLPETVFFPSVSLPLHLFEPRYLQMAEDVLSGSRRLVVVLLQPGWQRDYYGNPPVHEIATVGRIETHERLPGGRFNVILKGLERVRLLAPEGEERVEGKLYRARPVAPAPERPPEPGATTTAFAEHLRSLWRELAAKSGVPSFETSTPAADLSFDVLVNRLSSAVDVPPAMKQGLLEQDDLLVRATMLENYVEEALRFWRTLARYRRLAPDDARTN